MPSSTIAHREIDSKSAAIPTGSFLDEDRVNLAHLALMDRRSRRFTGFSIFTAAGSVTALIRDFGKPATADGSSRWALDAFDVLDRKYLAGTPPLIVCAGAFSGVVVRPGSEILPLEYRTLANGFAGLLVNMFHSQELTQIPRSEP
ncbi:hypothetical protein B0H17DRAFT_1147815 [Mycena rosella]|uniref:Uncharacterized protein n=1 Tax=Mycena rosella TaxID=1033263 RepID=A0AAD7FXV6_MYCRO|nr:hypothetical protein B0H17DRAFT_1147815 [Mycena rosella]